ncbi:MAG: hypothetical protein Q7R81_07565 [Candidatus Peregrinibacteria bacterium]|nr:hypothetical protein [Candidatus Peregrinibacteria bacterium]
MTIPKRRPVPNKRCSTVEDGIVSAIKGGATVEAAAFQCGIHPVTFLRWRRCDKPDAGTERDERCWNCRGCRLQQKVDCSLEMYKAVLLQRIHNATDREGNPIWQASAWLLERRFRDEFSLKTVIDNRHKVDMGNTHAEKLVAAIISGAARPSA